MKNSTQGRREAEQQKFSIFYVPLQLCLSAVKLFRLKLTQSRLSQNMFALLVGNVGGTALAFALSVLIGRVLGQTGLGIYATVLAWIFPLTLIVDFGLGSLITRDVAQDEALNAPYLHTSTLVRLYIGSALTLALLVGAPFLSDDPVVVVGLRVSAPLLLIEPFFGAFTAVFRARQIMWPIAWLNIGMLVPQVVLTIAAFAVGMDIQAALAINVITSAARLVAAWVIYRRNFVSWATHASPLQLAPLLRKAWPFALAAILAALQARVGILLLERLATTADVGYFAAASRFVEAGRMIPNAFFGALFPTLAALAALPEDFHATFMRAMRGLLVFGLAMGVGVYLLAAPVMSLTYGGEFAPAIPALQVAMWSLLPSLLRGARSLYWYAKGEEGRVNAVTALALVAQIALGLWLIPLYGALGLALTMLVSEAVALALLWPETRPRYTPQTVHET